MQGWRKAACAAAMALALGAAHAEYKAGMDALAVKDYAKARLAFEADAGNGAAVFQLARMALLGLGEARDETRAANLLKRASDLGHAEAKLEYAYALGNGRGTAENGPLAIKLLEELSGANHAEASITLARALMYGWWGVPKDEARAAKLFRAGMEAGDDDAAANYARAQMRGLGMAKDVDAGLQLLRQLADRGHVSSQVELAGLLMYGGELVARDREAAVALYRKAAANANAIAQYGLALAYANGWGVPRDDAMGVRWADAAARQGHTWAQIHMGDAYHTGVGVPRMPTEAFFWYTLAARSKGNGADRANERRTILARNLEQAQIERAQSKADAFRPVAGFRPREEALPPLARGEEVKLGSVAMRVPLPKGYANGWQLVESMQRAFPNDPGLRPLLMVLTQREDMERVKLGLAGAAFRNIEVSRHVPDDDVAITPALFADIKAKLLGTARASADAGRIKIDDVRDDARVLAVVRTTMTHPDQIEAFALLLVKQRVLALAFTGFNQEHRGELRDLVKATTDDLLSSNRGLFSE